MQSTEESPKPTSQKQIDANRLNAKKSTGPNTEGGKNISRRNAIRDHLTGQVTTLADADRTIFDQLRTEIVADFNPQTTMERKLAEAIAWDTWRLDRLRAVENNLFALGEEENCAEEAAPPDDYDTALTDARTFRAESARFDVMSLYEQRMTRNIHKNLAALRDIQSERKRQYQSDLAEEVRLARLNELNRVPIQASTLPSKNGFIFSDNQVAVTAVRQRHLETIDLRFKTLNNWILYEDLLTGSTDSFLQTKEETSEWLARHRALDKLNGQSAESVTMRRQSDPAAFGLFQQ